MRTAVAFCLLLLFAACNKEKIQQNAVISAMTNGQWKVVKFINGSTDVTADFAPYKFQFKDNSTVDAINNSNNSLVKTGTWAADANARTITSEFSGATQPVAWLNGTWKITNNSWTFVEATQTVNSEIRTLRLEKL